MIALKKKEEYQAPWLKPEILLTWEAKNGKVTV
jgi:hypothetical protein